MLSNDVVIKINWLRAGLISGNWPRFGKLCSKLYALAYVLKLAHIKNVRKQDFRIKLILYYCLNFFNCVKNVNYHNLSKKEN